MENGRSKLAQRCSFVNPKNVTSERPIVLMPTLIRWCEASRAPEVAKWQQKYRVDWDAFDDPNGGAQQTVYQKEGWMPKNRWWVMIARMENYLNKNDCLKLDIEELELLMGPEDSEVDLRYTLMNASRRAAGFSRYFARKRKVSTQLQAKCVGMCARDRGWRRRRKRSHKGARKMRTTKATFAGPRRVKGSRGEC